MASREKIEAFLAEPRNVIVAGVRKDGHPQITPNWFHWDGEFIYVSTMRDRAKYHIFKRDPRAQLAIDDSTGFRSVLIAARAEIREEISAELDHFRDIRQKHGMAVPSADEQLLALTKENRVLLAFRPEGPLESWTAWGLD